jgi:lipoate-protein ligase A
MKYVSNQEMTDPRINLAIEEYLLTAAPVKEPCLLFYINRPSVIIGKHQNTIEEINPRYVEEKEILVVRRLSGGGAVYHDLGNLNFSFISPDDGKSFANFKKFTEPVIRALHQMGVPAELSGRNDILVEGKKVSGNAQFAKQGRMISHGTLMFDVQLDEVVRALRVKEEKIVSKGIKSVRSRVTNLRGYLREDMTIQEFRERLLREIFAGESAIPEYHLTEDDWRHIHQISNQRYRRWEWNFGESPAFNLQREKRYPFGLIDIRLQVGEQGIIEECKIFGDFFSPGEIGELEEALRGVRYAHASLADALQHMDLAHYFPDLKREDFLDLLY